MISPETLRTVLAVCFGSLGILHFVRGRLLEKYAVEGGLLNAEVAVRMSGALLIVSSVAIFIEKYAEYGFYGFCLFLILSNIILHKFWSKNTGIDQWLELLHFVKNILLAVLIWYIKDQLI